MSQAVSFLLNNEEVTLSGSPGLLALDFIRQKGKLAGTKEGCKEGDCGACMVLVGELVNGRVEYKPMTSCLIPVGELHGKHLVTVEGLNLDLLSPIQQAIVVAGGSQCGFCTPGIVVSLTGLLIKANAKVDDEGIKYALGGNLCRCTGYASLKRAGHVLVKKFGNGTAGQLKTEDKNPVAALVATKALPDYFTTIANRLRKLPVHAFGNGKSSKFLVAGGTDIYVQRGDELPSSRLEILNLHPEMKGIKQKKDRIHVGALTTFEEFADSPTILEVIPAIKQYMHLNASWQIRNRATLGGNIVNASPIGDMTILLLALECKLVLQNGTASRIVDMKSFFKGYKKLEKKTAEILTEIIFPVPQTETKIHFEKVSKRKTLDIASVNSAIKVRVNDEVIEDMQLTMGGVAPIPLYLNKTSQWCRDREITPETVQQTIQFALSEISPISDVRGSAEYKRLLVRQFIICHFTKLFPEFVNVRDLL